MHWHGYKHTGSGAPEFLSHWLHKSKSSVEKTFDDPESAVEWLSMAFSEAHTSPERQPEPSVEARRPHSLETLSMGNSLCYSSWVTTTKLVGFYVISCPPPGGTSRCPEARQDSRPEGAVQITGVP